MHILVTGGRGYLGGRIAKNFKSLGHTVSITTRQLVNDSLTDASINILSPDWNSSSQLRETCEGIDVVIHAAGMNAHDCLRNPELAIEFNGNATKRITIAAESSGVKKFIYLSTAHVYSDLLVNSLDEDSPTLNKHPYATSHLLGEKNVLCSQDQGNMQRYVLRLSNVFGKPANKNTQCWNLFVNDVAKQIAEHSSINLKTNGKQKRDFVTMSDLLDFISSLSEESFPSTYPELMNFGSGLSMSLLDMTSLMSEISLSVFGFAPPIRTRSNEILAEDKPFTYSSKYNTLIKQFRKNEIRQEIFQLLAYTKLNFRHEK